MSDAEKKEELPVQGSPTLESGKNISQVSLPASRGRDALQGEKSRDRKPWSLGQIVSSANKRWSEKHGRGERWRARFLIHCLSALARADGKVQRRELVWIRRYLLHAGIENHDVQLSAALGGEIDEIQIDSVFQSARDIMTRTDKRHFVHDMAQLCKSKDAINDREYELILDFGQRIGIDDIECDEIINSVFSISDSFMAILGLLGLALVLHYGRPIIVPVLLSLFVAMIIRKAEDLVTLGLHRSGIPRWTNKIIAVSLILLGLFGIALIGKSSAENMILRGPDYIQRLQTSLGGVISWIENSGLKSYLPAGSVHQWASSGFGATFSDLSAIVSSVFGVIDDLLTVAFLAAFFAFSASSYEKSRIISDMTEKLSDYISIKLIVCLAAGTGTGLFCLIFGLQFSLFWATFAFLASFVPTVGALIAALPPALIGLLQLESTPIAIVFAGLLTCYQLVLANALEPNLLGSRLALNQFALLLGLLFWGFLWGTAGVFLAAPLMALVKAVAANFNFSRSLERFLAVRSPTRQG